MPGRLILSGSSAPEVQRLDKTHLLSSAELLARIRGLDASPSALLEGSPFLDLFLPVLRADLEMVESLDEPTGPPLDIPFTLFLGTEDQSTLEPAVRPWSTHTTRPLTVRHFQGGHFFQMERGDEVLRALEEELWRPGS